MASALRGVGEQGQQQGPAVSLGGLLFRLVRGSVGAACVDVGVRSVVEGRPTRQRAHTFDRPNRALL